MRACLVAMVLMTSSLATAQPTKGPAKTAYDAGRKAYDLREWDKAIESFKEAYRLGSDAASLFNIAQSYRLKGDCGEALGFYKTYKRNFPKAKNIKAVDGFITDMETCAKEQAAKKPVDTKPVDTKPVDTKPVDTKPVDTKPVDTKPVDTKPVDTKPVDTKPVDVTNPVAPTEPIDEYADRGGGKRTVGLVVAGVGVAAIGAGVVFGLKAKSKSDEINGGNAANPQPFDPAVEDDGKRYDLLAKIALGAGGALVVTGVVVYIIGKSAEHTRVSVVPTDGGAMFGVALTR